MSEKANGKPSSQEHYYENGLLRVQEYKDANGRGSGHVYREDGSLAGAWVQITNDETCVLTIDREGGVAAVDIERYDAQDLFRQLESKRG